MSARTLLALALVAAGGASASAQAPGESGTAEAQVVSLVVTYQAWDQDRPWAKKNPQVRRAESVVVPGPYLLTTAFVMADATHIEVEWATIVLNFRQAFTLSVVSLILVMVLRLLYHILVIACRSPAEGLPPAPNPVPGS